MAWYSTSLVSGFTKIGWQNYANSRRILEAADAAGARRVKEMLGRSPGLPDPIRVHIEDELGGTWVK